MDGARIVTLAPDAEDATGDAPWNADAVHRVIVRVAAAGESAKSFVVGIDRGHGREPLAEQVLLHAAPLWRVRVDRFARAFNAALVWVLVLIVPPGIVANRRALLRAVDLIAPPEKQ